MTKPTKQRFVLAVTAAALLFSSCSASTKSPASDDAEKPAEPTGPPQPVTAKTALWPMYTSARSWTTDCVIVRIASKELTGINNDAGKAGMWEMTFVSPSRNEYRIYSYAVAANPPAPYKGVSMSAPLPWSGFTRDVMPFTTSDISIDSDSAYNTAAAQAGIWLKKHPDKKLSTFELGNAYKFGAPVWVLTWGDNKSGYRVFVNASTGKIVNKK